MPPKDWILPILVEQLGIGYVDITPTLTSWLTLAEKKKTFKPSSTTSSPRLARPSLRANGTI